MNTNLVMYDVDLFLEKYTRFMTKDIYISMSMYDNFLKQYDYLYKKLKEDAILYRENVKYKKIFEIKDNKSRLLKLHNQKYLKKCLIKYNDLFENIKLSGNLDNNQKNIILAEEDKLIVINNKNIDNLIVGKIKYLIEVLKVKEEKILLLVSNKDKITNLLSDNKMDKVHLFTYDEYILEVLGNREIVTNDIKYNILIDYIMNNLFIDKDKFNGLYEAFYDNIYLNKDYINYETFEEYHNYMYKRSFLSSKLSLNKFVDREINKRKKFLRTIKNELVNCKEEVELANYLCFNGINYKYLANEKCFFINNKVKINIVDIANKDIDINIILCKEMISNNLYDGILREEFNLRHIEYKKNSYKDIYEILKNSMLVNYFSGFINKYLIKYLDYYDVNKNFSNTKLNSKQIDVLVEIYNYYINYIKDNNYITDSKVISLVQKALNSKYKYVIVNSSIILDLKVNNLQIIDEYQNIDFLKGNVKLLYDYKKYMNDNKKLVMNNTFVDENEIDELTNLFLKDNLNFLNECLINSDKMISIYFYDDSNRLYINKNISKLCYELIKKNKDIAISGEDIKGINSLVYKDFFENLDKKRLVTNTKRVVEYEDLLGLKKNYDKIILPFLIKDSYHEDLLINNNNFVVKMKIYIGLNKCRKELIVVCPVSKRKNVSRIFKGIKNVVFFE